MKRTIAVIISCAIALSPCTVDAGILWHATKRSLAKKIFTRGFSNKLMSPKARFGKGIYFGKSKITALKEKPKAGAVLRFRESKTLKNSSINLTHTTNTRLKALSGDTNLKGNIHNGLIGPDLGRKIGKYAARTDKSIIYKSAKDPKGTNFFIPSKVYQKHPYIIRKQGIDYVR
jgi:hypothetical protein